MLIDAHRSFDESSGSTMMKIYSVMLALDIFVGLKYDIDWVIDQESAQWEKKRNKKGER